MAGGVAGAHSSYRGPMDAARTPHEATRVTGSLPRHEANAFADELRETLTKMGMTGDPHWYFVRVEEYGKGYAVYRGQYPPLERPDSRKPLAPRFGSQRH